MSSIIKLREWQEEVVKIYNTQPDDRTIHWYWDRTGGTGKTTLSEHLCMMGETLCLSGKVNDDLWAVSKWVDSNRPLRAVILDISRSREEFVDYAHLHEIKDGIFFSPKYRSKMCIFNHVHVFVFANFQPDFTNLSASRWQVHDLNNN